MSWEPKSEIVPVRLTPTQVRVFREYAERDGLALSTWLREIARERLVLAAGRSASKMAGV